MRRKALVFAGYTKNSLRVHGQLGQCACDGVPRVSFLYRINPVERLGEHLVGFARAPTPAVTVQVRPKLFFATPESADRGLQESQALHLAIHGTNVYECTFDCSDSGAINFGDIFFRQIRVPIANNGRPLGSRRRFPLFLWGDVHQGAVRLIEDGDLVDHRSRHPTDDPFP